MITVDKALELANQLSLIDKIRLIEQLAAQLVQELQMEQAETNDFTPTPVAADPTAHRSTDAAMR